MEQIHITSTSYQTHIGLMGNIAKARLDDASVFMQHPYKHMPFPHTYIGNVRCSGAPTLQALPRCVINWEGVGRTIFNIWAFSEYSLVLILHHLTLLFLEFNEIGSQYKFTF